MRGGYMRERYQGGSLAGFVIIGVILTLVFVGGLYGLNRYNAEQSKEVASESKKDANDAPKEDRPTSSDTETDSSSDVPSDIPGTTTDDDAPDAGAKDDAANEELPATGPADVIGMVLGAAALSYAGALYLQSRSHRSR